MFLLSLLTNKDSYNTQIIQCVNDRHNIQVPGTRSFGIWNRFWNFRTGSLEPVPTSNHYRARSSSKPAGLPQNTLPAGFPQAAYCNTRINDLELGEKQSTWNWKISLFWSLYIPETVQDNMVTMEDYRICDLSNDDNAADQESTMTDYNKRPFLYFFFGGVSWVTLPRSKTQKVGRPSGWELHVNCHHSSAFT